MALDRRRSRGKRRRAVAGILAALMLFVMLFTVGTGYFLFVNQNNLLYSQALSTRSNSIQSLQSESLQLFPSEAGSNDILLSITNVGPAATTIVGVFVQSPSGTLTYVTSTASPPLPVSLNAGATSPTIDTGISYTSGTYALKVLTQGGGTFLTTYPLTATALAAQALSSGAIGDLYLAFQSYHYFTVYTGGGCPSSDGASGYCLEDQGKAFAIPSASTGPNFNTAFSVTITNLNRQEANIVLDPYTLMSLVPESGKGSLSYVNWFVISNVTTTIESAYTPIVLHYNTPVTVVFASGKALVSGVTFSSSALQPTGSISSGTTTPVFMVSHGCEAAGITTCNVASANYGQNSPYVTTLFY